MGVANVINPMVFGGGSIELTFSDGHTEKVSGKLCTGSKALDTTTMIPLVINGVGSVIDYCSHLRTYIHTTTKDYVTMNLAWRGVASGYVGYSVDNIYLPNYLPSLEELKNVRSYVIQLARDGGSWGYNGSSNTCLMWIETGGVARRLLNLFNPFRKVGVCNA